MVIISHNFTQNLNVILCSASMYPWTLNHPPFVYSAIKLIKHIHRLEISQRTPENLGLTVKLVDSYSIPIRCTAIFLKTTNHISHVFAPYYEISSTVALHSCSFRTTREIPLSLLTNMAVTWAIPWSSQARFSFRI